MPLVHLLVFPFFAVVAFFIRPRTRTRRGFRRGPRSLRARFQELLASYSFRIRNCLFLHLLLIIRRFFDQSAAYHVVRTLYFRPYGFVFLILIFVILKRQHFLISHRFYRFFLLLFTLNLYGRGNASR